jgi:hypothetical protein
LFGRPLRTVRDALSKLRRQSVIERIDSQPGRTAIYRLRLEAIPCS